MGYEFKEGCTIQILVDNWHVDGIVSDWYETNQDCDLRLRRAKTKGCTVIETKWVLFAHKILRYYPKVKVNIIERK